MSLKALSKGYTGKEYIWLQTNENHSLNNEWICLPSEKSKSNLSVTGGAVALLYYQRFGIFLTSCSTVLSMKHSCSWFQYGCPITRDCIRISSGKKGKNKRQKSLCLFIWKGCPPYWLVFVREASFPSGHLAVPILNAFPKQNLGFINK